LDEHDQETASTVTEDLRVAAKRADENFSVLSPLLPKRYVGDFAAVYAFCRRADDLADDVQPTPEGRALALERLRAFREALGRHLNPSEGAGDESHPDDAMLAELARAAERRSIRHEHFHHLLDAFEQDQVKHRYETWDEVMEYCRGSANPVGRIVLEIGGIDTQDDASEQIVRWSDTVCSALQFTNHWQDVRRDLLERDRVYLPSRDTGLSAEDLRAMIDSPSEPELRVRYIRALRPLVTRTHEMYLDARGLPDAIAETAARPLAPTVWLLGAGGEATLRRIERLGCTTLWKRPRLGPLSKAFLVLRAYLRAKRIG
jgi:squalene synthase HpnC